jgi:hypothetical protein
LARSNVSVPPKKVLGYGLNANLTLGEWSMPKKECKCEIIKVDHAKADGWQCKCFEINEGGSKRNMASAKGPNWNQWSPIVGGGTSASGNYGQATNPDTGEAFEVEYKCTC